MERFSRVASLENQMEAQILEEVLRERNIPHLIQSHFDDAYGGLFQFQKGWGVVQAPEQHAEEVRAILAEIRKADIQTEEDR
ncbi:MAG: DUF2007 domain-containing protein [Bacillaceae bacterium]|nr:DUF2007 domain-containing protein [Bacillaceae bacterium]